MKKHYLFDRIIIIRYFLFIIIAVQFLGCNSKDTDNLSEEVVNANLTRAESLLILVNEVRLEEGLSEVVLNDKLNNAKL